MKKTPQENGKLSDPLLCVEALDVTYSTDNGSVKGLIDLNFTLKKGERLGIIGETGSGKTTLARALFGLISPPHQISGRIIFGGEDLVDMSRRMLNRYRWRRLAMLFQNSNEVLNPVMRVGIQITETIKRHLQLKSGEREEELERLLEVVGLGAKWKEAYPHQLSGGMRQRVLLAMALSCRPELLIVDEPTASLDASARGEVLQLLDELQGEMGLTTLVISHDLSVISRMVDRLMVFYAGTVVESGPVSELLEEPKHPYTRGLLQSALELFPYRDLWGIPGEQPDEEDKEACPFAERCTQAIEQCRKEKPPVFVLKSQRRIRCHRKGIVTLLSASGIHKEYRVGDTVVQAVVNADIDLRHGEAVALVGHSGSGKSTLAEILAGYTTPDRGEVLFRNRCIAECRPVRRENGVQLVLQDPFDATSHRLTVLDAISEPLRINGIKAPSEQKKRVLKILREVQLPSGEEFYTRHCFSLSGGQRQRVALARALVMQPALLIADEITSMLDVSTQANLLRLLKGLQNAHGFAMLFITHDLNLARKVSERAFVMKEGHIVASGSAHHILTSAGDQVPSRSQTDKRQTRIQFA